VRHLPNLITIFRLASMPLIAYDMLEGQYRAALLLFAMAASTDSLDGWLARRYGWISKFGAIADPIADKLLLTISYVCLGYRGAMPLWLVAMVLGRDVLILLFAAVALLFTSLRDFPPSQLGKLSTFFQILAAGATLIVRAGFLGQPALEPLFLLAAGWTIVSGLHYFITGLSRFRTKT
jgi:cardiolipin synthase